MAIKKDIIGSEDLESVADDVIVKSKNKSSDGVDLGLDFGTGQGPEI